MKSILLLLGLVLAAYGAQLIPGIYDSTTLRSPPVPGPSMGFGAGYDVKIERVRMPLFQYTYNYDQTWFNPYNKQTYAYPDQTYLTEIAKGKVVKETGQYSEWHQVVKSVTSSFGLDVGLGYQGKDLANINFQRSHAKVDEMIKGGINNFAKEDRYYPVYQLDMWPDAEFNAHFQRLVDALPKTANTDAEKKKYTEFIRAVGTHYCTSAQFGGHINFTSIFQAVMTKRHTMEWTAYQIKLSLTWAEIKVGIDMARNKSTDKLDQDYYEHSYNETNCVGGECWYLEEGKYDIWAKTIGDMPGLIPAYQLLYPITELVDDTQKRATLKAQVIAYLSTPNVVADTGDWNGFE